MVIKIKFDPMDLVVINQATLKFGMLASSFIQMDGLLTSLQFDHLDASCAVRTLKVSPARHSPMHVQV